MVMAQNVKTGCITSAIHNGTREKMQNSVHYFSTQNRMLANASN